MSITVPIGNQPNHLITALGDECKYGSTIAYSYVIFKDDTLDSAREHIRSVQSKFGIPQDVQLHMRVLTNPAQRTKHGISHLTDEGVLSLVSEVVDRMNTLPFLVRGLYYSGELPPDIIDGEMSVRWSDKGMQSLLAKAALIPLNIANYKYTDLRIVLSRDSTVLPFLGTARRQATGWARGFSTIDAPAGHVYEFMPAIERPDKEVLLQLADIIVYAITHAFDGQPSPEYRRIVEQIRNIDVRPLPYRVVEL